MGTALLLVDPLAWAATPLPPADTLTATSTTYYHADYAGNIRAESDRAGTLTATHRYEPFGLTLPDETLSVAAPRFGGKLRDPVSGLDDFGARDFGAQYGRFLSVDPVAFGSKALANPQDLNLYGYGLNNPLTYGDPTGRAAKQHVRRYACPGGRWNCEGDAGRYLLNMLGKLGDKFVELNDQVSEALTPLGPNPELAVGAAAVGISALVGKIGVEVEAVEAAIASIDMSRTTSYPAPPALRALLDASSVSNPDLTVSALRAFGKYVAQGRIALTSSGVENQRLFLQAIDEDIANGTISIETLNSSMALTQWRKHTERALNAGLSHDVIYALKKRGVSWFSDMKFTDADRALLTRFLDSPGSLTGAERATIVERWAGGPKYNGGVVNFDPQ